MSPLQRFFFAILPKSWAEDMRASTEQWVVGCTCGFERSLWALGGVRWKGSGRSWTYLHCPQCGRRSWHAVRRRQPAEGE